MQRAICVILNSQHQERVDDFMRRCGASPDSRMIFQPYTEKRLRSLHKIDEESALPVPIYLISGQYGATATVVGDLVKVEYRDEVPNGALKALKKLLPVTDTKIYATNLLYLAHARVLRPPVAVERFLKVSDEQPLRRGRWPAVVGYAPRLAGTPQSRPSAGFDDLEEAPEGHVRELYVRHRHREQRLRSAKIKQVLGASGRLRCEVPGCGFDFRERYGSLGHEYAHVHHLYPLSAAGGSRPTRLNDLVIVCANCHAMIHRNGECRLLKAVSAAIEGDVGPDRRAKTG